MADLGGAPYDLKFSQFHAVFFWKIWQNYMLAPPGRSAHPPTGNPGSAAAVVETAGKLHRTVYVSRIFCFISNIYSILQTM